MGHYNPDCLYITWHMLRNMFLVLPIVNTKKRCLLKIKELDCTIKDGTIFILLQQIYGKWKE
jgi:hypothetical protein